MSDSYYDDYDSDDEADFEVCSFCGQVLVRRKDNGECRRCWDLAHYDDEGDD